MKAKQYWLLLMQIQANRMKEDLKQERMSLERLD
jgi:hypothetical protein